MKYVINKNQTVTVTDASGDQTTSMDSFAALTQEARRLGVNIDTYSPLSALGNAVAAAGGNPGIIVTRSGRAVSMKYVGIQNFERFDIWVDGVFIDSSWGLTHTTTVPLLPAGTYIVTVSASWASVPILNPGERISFPYVSDGIGYVQPHPTQVPIRTGAALVALPSGYLRSVFAVYSLTVQSDLSIQGVYQLGALTHIEEGMFDCVNYPDQVSGQAQFNARWARVSSVCSTYGVKLLALGDDLCRGDASSNLAIVNATTGWRPALISSVCATMQNSGYLTGVLMVDEADLFATAATDVQLDSLMASMKSSAPALKLTWPVHSAGATRFTSRSDWLDLYWTIYENRYAQGFSTTTIRSSIAQILSDLRVAVSAAPANKPFSLLNSIMGTDYGAGAAGSTPEMVTAQTFIGWCLGAIGCRSYTYDYGSLPGGTQVGATPASVGADRWAAMQASYSLIAQLESRFGFGTTMTQDATYDPDVLKTTRGAVTIAVNCSEGVRGVPGMATPSYRLIGALVPKTAWSGVLQPMEVAVWV